MNDRFRHRTRVSRTTAVGKTGSVRSRIGASAQRSQALLTTLYRSTDCLCRSGAAMKNLAQSASLHAGENNAPSKPGTKHLVLPAATRDLFGSLWLERRRCGGRRDPRDQRNDIRAAASGGTGEALVGYRPRWPLRYGTP